MFYLISLNQYISKYKYQRSKLLRMSLSIFAIKNQHFRNGTIESNQRSKMVNRLVGGENYDSFRVYRRIMSSKFYYSRQYMLYKVFAESPDVACMLGIYPKVDSSHGFGHWSKF